MLDLGIRAEAGRQGGSIMEGGNIMKRNVVWGVLAGIGLVALSTTVAQASDGGMPFALTSFFVCNSINGDDAEQVVDSEIPGIGPIRKGVRIGNGVLGCAVAKLLDSVTKTEIQPNPSGNLQQFKCYSVTVSPRNSGSPPPSYSVTDQFFPFPPTRELKMAGSSL